MFIHSEFHVKYVSRYWGLTLKIGMGYSGGAMEGPHKEGNLVFLNDLLCLPRIGAATEERKQQTVSHRVGDKSGDWMWRRRE